MDAPFEHNRTILIPADPIPIANPRPEYYPQDDSPISPVSYGPLASVGTVRALLTTANIGNMVQGGGLDAPYVGIPQRSSPYASLLNPSSSATTANWIGKNWSSAPGQNPALQPLWLAGQPTGLQYQVGSVTIYAPTNQSFLGLASARLTLSGWDGSAWHTLWSGLSAGTAGESISIGSSQLSDTNPYYVHAVSVFGDGVNAAAIAFVQINTIADGVLSAPTPTPSAPVVSS